MHYSPVCFTHHHHCQLVCILYLLVLLFCLLKDKHDQLINQCFENKQDQIETNHAYSAIAAT